VAEPTLTTYPKRAMFPWNRGCYNLWCLSGRQSLWKATGHWQVVYSETVGKVHAYGAWPGGRSVCLFCGNIVLCRLLGLDPLSWVVVRTKDPLRESRIPGGNVGKLTSPLYPIVIPSCI
jgi:hypothetical protein